MSKITNITIERARGETYATGAITAYGAFRYERGSVLAGRTGRRFLETDFETVEDAVAWARENFPGVRVDDLTAMNGTTYRADSMLDIPDGPDLR